MYNKKPREKKSRNELSNSLRNVDALRAMLLRTGLLRKKSWPSLRVSNSPRGHLPVADSPKLILLRIGQETESVAINPTVVLIAEIVADRIKTAFRNPEAVADVDQMVSQH